MVSLGLLVALLAATAVAQQPSATAIDEARALQKQGRQADALAVLRRAVDASPADAAVRNMLGALLNRDGHYPEALVHAEAAVAAAPDEFRYRLNRGIVLAEHGRFAEAIADFDFALSRSTSLPMTGPAIAGASAKRCSWRPSAKRSPAGRQRR